MTTPQTENKRSFPFRILLLGATLFFCIGCDQYTKKLAVDHLTNAPVKTYLDDTIRIQHVKNSGGFLGLGETLSPSSRFWVFTVINGLLLFGICLFLWKKRDIPIFSFFSLVLFLAGGIGNQIDRLMQQGLVTDFLNLGIGPIRTGIFNVADVAISVGLLMLCWTWKQETPQENEAPSK